MQNGGGWRGRRGGGGSLSLPAPCVWHHELNVNLNDRWWRMRRAAAECVCDSVIVSMINSAAVLTESTRELAKKKKKRKRHRLVPHQEMLFIPLCTPLPPPHPHPFSLFCVPLPLSLSQRPLLVINTAVCISRMHLALTQMLKKVISGCMWLLWSL